MSFEMSFEEIAQARAVIVLAVFAALFLGGRRGRAARHERRFGLNSGPAFNRSASEVAMKRSKSIGLVMMGASAIALTACEEQQVDAMVFESVQQCYADAELTREQCDAEYESARTAHVQAAPKYTSIEACQADFGPENCEQAPQRTTGGGSVFMPLMMGYMMGSMLGGARSGVAAQPLYRSADDPKSFRTADNKNVGDKVGRTRVARSAGTAPGAKTRTTSRGGFGKSARTFGPAAG